MQNPRAAELSNLWFAVQVFAGRERLAANHLMSRGYDVFLPCYFEHRRWSDRVKRIERALFDGYLFCRLHSDIFGKVITAPGVIRIVGDGARALPIPDDEIDAIRRIVDAGLTAEPWPYVRAGQRVRISDGPLRDVEGIVTRVKTRDRLIVSVSLLQRSVAVEVDAHWATALASGPCVLAPAS
jgi:transcription antitermination factor NusG